MAAVKYVASVAVVVALAAVTATADVVAVSAVANDLYNILSITNELHTLAIIHKGGKIEWFSFNIRNKNSWCYMGFICNSNT